MNKRRVLLRSLSLIATAPIAGIPLSAFAQPKKIDENEPQAVSLGYKHDTTNVDQKKFPKHNVSQICNDCQFYQANVKEAWGPCTIFAGKLVASKGWCSAYVKKAA